MYLQTYLQNGQYTIELEPTLQCEEAFLSRFFDSNDEPTIQKRLDPKTGKTVITISKGM